MKTPKTERTDGGENSYTCDNCGTVWPFEKLYDIADLSERLDDGGPTPAGECPVDGALCYADAPEPEQRNLYDDRAYAAWAGKIVGRAGRE